MALQVSVDSFVGRASVVVMETPVTVGAVFTIRVDMPALVAEE